MKRIGTLWRAKAPVAGTPEARELKELAAAVDAYEVRTMPEFSHSKRGRWTLMPLDIGQGRPSAHHARVLEQVARRQRAEWKRDAPDLRTRRMLKRRFPDLLALMSDEPTFRGMDASIARDDLLFERGWLPLVVELLEKLTVLTPASKRGLYRVSQIKEKWGALRLHFDERCTGRMARTVRAARRRSMRICELCGRPGRTLQGLGVHGGMTQTVCPVHAVRLIGPRLRREVAAFDGSAASTMRLRRAVYAARDAGVVRALDPVVRRAVAKLADDRVTIEKILAVVPDRRLRLRLSDGSLVERDFSLFTGGVFKRFAEPRYFARVRLVHGVLTWPGPKGWNEHQVVDLSPDDVIWGVCPAPATTRKPPATMVVGKGGTR
jgi:hypothetical protein